MNLNGKKAYMVEFCNGKPYDDGWSYPIEKVFMSFEKAKDYIQSQYLEVKPEEYDTSDKKKLPDRRYYTKESVNYESQHEFRLEDDKFEKFAHYIYEGHSFFTIHEVEIVE